MGPTAKLVHEKRLERSTLETSDFSLLCGYRGYRPSDPFARVVDSERNEYFTEGQSQGNF